MKSQLRLKNKRNTNLPKVERTKLQEIGLGVERRVKPRTLLEKSKAT
jgi:hypothetical protein